MHSDDDWTIVLLTTRGLSEFVENALLGITRCGIDPKIVQVLMPANAEEELSGIVKAHGARPRIFEEAAYHSTAMPTGYVDYGSADFRDLVRLRVPLLRAILRESERIVYADIDVSWLRNPLPYLSKVLSRFPWACQTEPAAYFPPLFCVGFFACRASPECFELLDTHIKRFRDDVVLEGKSMSEAFWHMLDENLAQLATIFPLPEALFPTGLLYSAVRGDPKISSTMVAHLEPFIFHGNWTIGLENKGRLLKHEGAWFVPPQNGAKPNPRVLRLFQFREAPLRSRPDVRHFVP